MAFLTGTISRVFSITKSAAGALGLSGAPTRSSVLARTKSGAVGLSGAVTNDAGVQYYTYTAAGALGLAGAVSRIVIYHKSAAGVLSFTGAQPTRLVAYGRREAGGLDLAGDAVEAYKEALYYGVRG